MYGSYGSYSSLSSVCAPLDISNMRTHDASCAYPSWPRRASLSDSDEEARPTSFLSDDDLFLPDPFDDDARSVSSSGSGGSSAPRLSDEELMRLDRDRAALQREMLRQVKLEKERRRQMASRARRGSAKKSPKAKAAGLTTITEAGE
ncbi:hypothetical protein CDD80_117 [Ophiocordyceps camponoti-rufipedis]|uniref:Uncharacterized protein n=1 Tax=Ophiocordyceps camponoti-rufipedis TaxID=2004952 RepID=A0A2C5YKP4_9HYPO|nr:hypothetical protein CDD80_117 [Ophiocordyceps camponoti-rufipedis]